MNIWLLCIVFLFTFTTQSFAGIKKIAVLDFEDTSIAASTIPTAEEDPVMALAILRGYKPTPHEKGFIGKGVSNMLVTELVKDGVYTIVERSRIEEIMREQNMGKDGVLSASEAAKIGKILGVSAVVMGSVTEFNTKTEKHGAMMFQKKVRTATVALNARMVDTSSAEIIFAAEGRGQEDETNVRVGSYGSNTTGAREALLSAATKKALTGIIDQLKATNAKLKDAAIEGYVANIDQKSILIDIGSDHGLAKDQKLYVVKVVKEVKSPTTGEVIKKIMNVVGEIQVAELERKAATCICVSGNCTSIKERDRVSTSKN